MDYDNKAWDEAQFSAHANRVCDEATRAFLRLVAYAEESRTNQGVVVARFVATVLSAELWSIYDLRLVDPEAAADMLVCLDALRTRRFELYDVLPGGLARCIELCIEYGFASPDAIVYDSRQT